MDDTESERLRVPLLLVLGWTCVTWRSRYLRVFSSSFLRTRSDLLQSSGFGGAGKMRLALVGDIGAARGAQGAQGFLGDLGRRALFLAAAFLGLLAPAMSW